MSKVGSWSGWRRDNKSGTSYCTGVHTELDIGSSTSQLIDYVDMEGVGRLALTYDNNSSGSIIARHYVTDLTSPNQTFATGEWVQVTNVVVGSGTFQRYTVDADTGSIGPCKWFATVGSTGSTTAYTGSMTIYVNLHSN